MCFLQAALTSVYRIEIAGDEVSEVTLPSGAAPGDKLVSAGMRRPCGMRRLQPNCYAGLFPARKPGLA